MLAAINTAQAGLPDPSIGVYLNTPLAGQALVGTTAGFYSSTITDGTNSGTVTLGSDPSVSATATNTGQWPGDINYGGSSVVDLTYYMEICIPTCGLGSSTTQENILVGMAANTMISAAWAGSVIGELAIVDTNYAWRATSGTNVGVSGVPSIVNSNNFQSSTVSLYSNTVYEISLSIQAYANSISQSYAPAIAGSVSGTVDPTFSFAPGSAVPGGNFIFSPGVSSVPVPPTLVLFASGLFAISTLRKKKPQTAKNSN